MATRKVSDKMLESVLKKLTARFGENYKTKGLATVELEATPTGHDDLDVLLTKGARGFAKGCIVELMGSEGSGKCLTRDTYCLTPTGMKTIEEIFEESKIPCDASQGFVECEYDILNENGEFETTSHFYRNYYGPHSQKTIKITTKDGFCVNGTHNHPVRVMNEHGYVVWKKLQQLELGDYVCISRSSKVWNDGSNLSKSEASLLGYMVGDGGYTLPNRISFTNVDARVVADFITNVEDVFGRDVAVNLRSNGISLNLNNKQLVQDFREKHGLQCVKSTDKRVPKSVRCANKSAQASFIKSYFDCDGTFQSEKHNLQFSSASIHLLQELQLLLLNFGIYAHITASYNQKYERDYYELELSGAELDLYVQQIGFNQNEKTCRIVDCLHDNSKSRNPNLGSIPNQSGKVMSLYDSLDPHTRNRDLWRIFSDIQQDKCLLTYVRLEKIIEVVGELQHPLLDDFRNLLEKNYVFSPITSIDFGFERTYDFTLPLTHAFWSNGIISHNTSLAMRVVGNAQKAGEVCAWFDTERAFSYALAEINGMEPVKLYLPPLVKSEKSADDFELMNVNEILEMVYRSIVANIYGIVVLDSVAGLIPERVLAEDFNPNSAGMAEVARSMSSMLGKIAQAAAQTQTTVIFINQLREKPGEYFKDRFHTPGGRALKFFAHQRLSVEKKNGASGQVLVKDEDGHDTLIGHYARCTIVKNRMAPPVAPTTSIEIPIYYVEYNPDEAKLCYDLARSLQVVAIRNGVLTWKDNETTILKVEGEADFLAAIREQQLEAYLATCCVAAGKNDKNTKKKQPVRISVTIEELAATYVSSPKPKATKKATKKVLQTDLEVGDEQI